MKKKLYVDAQLRVVSDVACAKAIVNEFSDDKLQIMFLDPIDHDADMSKAIESCRIWISKNYRHYYNKGRVILPKPEICLLANKNCTKPCIVSCHTSGKKNFDTTYRRILISEFGIKEYGWGNEKRKNVYPAIYILKKKFLQINRNINLNEYEFISPEQ